MDKQVIIFDTDICPDLSELMGMDDIPMIVLKKGDKGNGTNDTVGHDTPTNQD